ncbi:death-on-curing protein [Subtercola boreus]|uniref:Death-on-curing protein n=1 Tax=Subtercola boreus TaxID=120213 RepID=A0A3E0VK08_9MICO|nr:type II toxin-antitoxin system death-on-curing family toxin [Subtercola boreus]RFA09740.1 death-on-curing protein [Subtercola boreus]TQL53153.1 death-on-curing protein [Subtercola boreus]
MTVQYLTLEHLLALAEDLGVPSVRDIGLLDSAAHRPQSSLFGNPAYPSVHLKAAVLLESLVRNHALVDGNNRLGWMAVYVFYGINGMTLEAPDDAAYDLVISTATGESNAEAGALLFASWTSTS